jgi:hypothetical protein
MPDQVVQKALKLLDVHYFTFVAAKPYADETGHTVPCDTKSWSQVLVSVLTGLSGRARKKGSDLDDGSDVKAANTWSAIDTPRFNGAIPSGRTTAASRKPPDVSALDDTPYIFFVLWDEMGSERLPRCRIWVVRPQHDPEFRRICSTWYTQRAQGIIKSDNFQLHPPRNQDHDVIRNSCGNLIYPLFFCAVRQTEHFELVTYNPDVLKNGMCRPAD